MFKFTTSSSYLESPRQTAYCSVHTESKEIPAEAAGNASIHFTWSVSIKRHKRTLEIPSSQKQSKGEQKEYLNIKNRGKEKGKAGGGERGREKCYYKIAGKLSC